jgi:mono/diheme cytochrome c family protein
MKKILVFVAAGLLFLFLIPSCYYDNVEDLYPFEAYACDTTTITYSQTIAPIMAANCNTCHNSANPNGNPPVITSDYTGLSVVAKNGKLWNAVDHVNGGSRDMPQNANKLSDCDLAKINIWIKADSLKY